jgi:hypothetical protein
MERALSVIGRLASRSKLSKTACLSGWIQKEESALSRLSWLLVSLSIIAGQRLHETAISLFLPTEVTEHVRMDVQTDVGHVV